MFSANSTKINADEFVPAFLNQQAERDYLTNPATWEETQEELKRRNPKRKKNPEGKLQKSIIAWLEVHGCVAIRVNSGLMKLGGQEVKDEKGKVFSKYPTRFIRMNSASGCSDILACVPCKDGARFAAIEVKTGSNPLSANQENFLWRITRSCGIAFVARSLKDVEEALPWLK
jgi:hypothetical protein